VELIDEQHHAGTSPAPGSGIGLAHLPSFYLEAQLRAGALVTVLEGHEPPEFPANLVYPSRKHQPAAVRALTAHLIAWFQQTPTF